MLVKLAAIGAPTVRLAAEKVQVPPPSSSRRSDETRLAYAWNPGIRGTADSGGHVALIGADGAPGPTWRADRYVTDLAWHPLGAMPATAGDDGVHLLRLSADAAAEVPLPVHAGGPATAVAFAPDGRTLAVARGGAAPQIEWLPLPAP